jgi:hypothetical protein
MGSFVLRVVAVLLERVQGGTAVVERGTVHLTLLTPLMAL